MPGSGTCTESGTAGAAPRKTHTATVAIIGNPNTGKSTLFNRLTGFRQRVGNYPGVTVEKRIGTLPLKSSARAVQIIDLPGCYSLSARSRDEAIALDVLTGRVKDTPSPDVIVVVVDASRLRRNLFLLSQLLELGRPTIIALNMMDIARTSGVSIDTDRLSRALGIPVIPVIASRNRNVTMLAEAIQTAVDSPAVHHAPMIPRHVDQQAHRLISLLKASENAKAAPLSKAELLQAVFDPGGCHERRLLDEYGSCAADLLATARDELTSGGQGLAQLEARLRYPAIDELTSQVIRQAASARKDTTGIDRMLTHPVWGLIIFLIILGVIFQSVYAWAVPLMDGVEGFFGAIGSAAASVIPEGPLQSLVVDGAVAGVGGVLVFLPQILILFLFIAILEDCGYLSRAALLADRYMRVVGLSGKSVIPLLSSFACAVPGLMAARTIEGRRDRFLTMLIAPLMSCSARLPVYLLLIGAFVPATGLLGGVINLQALVLLAMYMVGVVVAIPVALVARKTVLRGTTEPLLIELPTYKLPSPTTVFLRMYEQGREFCIRAGTIIFAAAIVVWALGYFPRPADIHQRFENERQQAAAELSGAGESADEELQSTLAAIDDAEAGAYLRQSYLGRMGTSIEPAVRPLGWDWKIGTAAIASFPAREVVIATLGTIYNLGTEHDEESAALRVKLRNATWPDGRPVFNIPVALSLMVFFALCCQCVSTLAVMRRETQSWRWPIAAFVYMTGLAYVASWVTYRIGMLWA